MQFTFNIKSMITHTDMPELQALLNHYIISLQETETSCLLVFLVPAKDVVSFKSMEQICKHLTKWDIKLDEQEYDSFIASQVSYVIDVSNHSQHPNHATVSLNITKA